MQDEDFPLKDLLLFRIILVQNCTILPNLFKQLPGESDCLYDEALGPRRGWSFLGEK
jgi:hypothetical protein